MQKQVIWSWKQSIGYTMIYSGPNWVLTRPFAIILSLCTKMTHFKTIWPDFFIFIYIIYIYIIYRYIHHMNMYVPLKRCMYTCTIINTCVTSTTKNISEDSCTTYTYMHHQEHISGYMHHIHIHALHTHTCTTKYHKKIRYA